MKRSELEAQTRANLITALLAAGCTGLSRAKKDELVSAALKLRGGARERFLSSLKETDKPVAAVATKPVRKAAAKAKIAEPVEPSHTEKQPRIPEKAAAETIPTPLGETKTHKFDVDRNGQARGVPEPGDFPLPESYGMDLFHVLVFDPSSAYVFWELSPELLASLAEKHSGKWDSRRLCVRALARDGSFVQQELYGDRGSYYLELGFAGQRVAISLGFLVDGGFEHALPSRTVLFPRDSECEETSVRLIRLKPSQSIKEGSPITPEEAFGEPLEKLGKEHRRWQPGEAVSSPRRGGEERGDD